MTGSLHLISRDTARRRPIHDRLARAWAAIANAKIIGVGGMVDGAACSLPLVRHRIGGGWTAARRWGETHLDGDELVAWDEHALAAAVATGRPVTAVLDGVGLTHAWSTRRTRSLIRAGDVRVLPSSHAVAAALGSDATPLPPVEPAWIEATAGDSPPALVIGAEPSGAGSGLAAVTVLGRLALLGHEIDVVRVGRSADADHVQRMLARIGVSVMEVAPNEDVVIGSRTAVLCASASPGIAPVAPVVRWWASGGTVLLPSNHPAAEVLAGQSGVVLDVNGRPDDAVRQLLEPLADAPDRGQVLAEWAASFEQSLSGMHGRE